MSNLLHLPPFVNLSSDTFVVAIRGPSQQTLNHKHQTMSSFKDITHRHMELLVAVIKGVNLTIVDWAAAAYETYYKTPIHS